MRFVCYPSVCLLVQLNKKHLIGKQSGAGRSVTRTDLYSDKVLCVVTSRGQLLLWWQFW